jgi:hypothetical protein
MNEVCEKTMTRALFSFGQVTKREIASGGKEGVHGMEDWPRHAVPQFGLGSHDTREFLLQASLRKSEE